ncbi:MAG: TrkA C-terminal domain-containing protein [Bacteroidota bacterium]
MIETFVEYPILLLFTVGAIGTLLGNVSIRGNSLGPAAILFTGLIFGALDQRLQIPQVILFLGLSIYVYSIGLSSGQSFFQTYKRNGLRDLSFILFIFIFSGSITVFTWWLLELSAASIVGVYAGSNTNTAALAGLVDYFGKTYSDTVTLEGLTEATVVGFSFSYPMGVLGGMIAIAVMEKVFKINYQAEAKQLRKLYPTAQKLERITVKVTQSTTLNKTLRDWVKENDWKLSFGRLYRENQVDLIHWDTKFEVGDYFTVVGNEEDLEALINIMGERSESHFGDEQSLFQAIRIFVSNSDVAGRSIASLSLKEKYNATITRIRRGDIDMIATPDTQLKLGDRIRLIAAKEDIDALSQFFGDSYQTASKVNMFSFGLGIGIGLLLGTVEFNFGGGLTFQLGYVGGVLIVGLILGAIRRTGSIVWELPYSANITLQQIGLIFLLSVIGVRSGNSFVNSFSIEGIWLFFGSIIISLSTAFFILYVGYKILKIPFSFLLGMVANQPAILEFAEARTKNKIPMHGYALMFPIALVLKILLTQVLFIVLS